MESTVGILANGYDFFQKKFDQNNTDVYQTHLLFQKTIVIRGAEAAEIFYDQQKFKRSGATPKRFQKTLFGEGGVQGLDGKNHIHRKSLFMEQMKPESLQHIGEIYKKHWKNAVPKWANSGEIILFDEVEKILTRTACEWTGVPLQENELDLRTRHLSAMIDASGGVGYRFYKGKLARKRAERWLKNLVRDVRNRELKIAEDTVFHRFCFHKDLNDNLLDEHTVAVEVLNLLRPIVAIARFVVFEALALHRNPQYSEKIKNEDDEYIHSFVQEVRRFYPFFPFVAAIVTEPFSWQGVEFPKKRRVLLDLYATTHDQRLWENPEAFHPERFNNREATPFDLIPQGGGDHYKNHRCAGEWITIKLMEISLSLLVNEMNYEVPEQNLEIDMARIPAIPKSRFEINDVSAAKNS